MCSEVQKGRCAGCIHVCASTGKYINTAIKITPRLPTTMHANTTGRPVHLCLSAFIGGYFYTSPSTKKIWEYPAAGCPTKYYTTPAVPSNHIISPFTPPRAESQLGLTKNRQSNIISAKLTLVLFSVTHLE